MKLKTTLFGETYRFDSVRDVLNKAGELRSGDVLAGVAASSMQERVAAKQVLSELTLGDLREHPVVPYEDDAVTRIIQDAVHTPVYESIRNWSVGEFREFLLDGRTSSAAIERVRKGLTSEMAAAVSKIMSNADLIFAAKKMPVVVRSNNTCRGSSPRGFSPTTRGTRSRPSWRRCTRGCPTARGMRSSASIR